MQKRWVRMLLWGTTIAVMLMIAWFSSQNGEKSNKMSDGVVDSVLGNVQQDATAEDTLQLRKRLVTIVRKGAHIMEYALLGVSLCLLHMSYAARYGALRAWGIASVYGALDEVHQLFSEGRAGRITDILIDASGAAVGVLAVVWLAHMAAKKRAD